MMTGGLQDEMQSLLLCSENHDTMESVTVSLQQAKVLADHYLALARYWRTIAKLPPVITAAGQRKEAETMHR